MERSWTLSYALLLTLLLGSQLFIKASNRQASLFDCFSSINQCYGAWLQNPATLWLVRSVRSLVSPFPQWSQAPCVLLVFGGGTLLLWYQNSWS